ncbi:solute carrier family 53 member 1-like isoform X2 [Corticium candelabrum]|nr:solute carrier family 53 member 1-like isoform X2 [Corticium candelabrum]
MQVIDKEVEKIEAFFKSREGDAKSSFLDLEEEVGRLKLLASIHGTQSKRREAAHWGKAINGQVAVGNRKAWKRKSFTEIEHQISSPDVDDEVDEAVRLSSREIKTRLKELKLAFSEFYLSLVLLQQYQQLNREGFRKILKKHDKEWRTTDGLRYYSDVILKTYFVRSKEIEQLILKTEKVVIEDLEGGNRRQAMNRLRVPPLETRYSHWSSYGLGLFMGMSSVLIVCSIILGVYLTNLKTNNCGNTTHPIDCAVCNVLNSSCQCEMNSTCRAVPEKIFYDWGNWIPALRMFRVTLFIFLMVFFVGVNTYGWRANGVNHVLIFEINPREYLSSFQLMEIGTCMSVIWLCGIMLYYAIHHFGSPDNAFFSPLTVMIVIIVYTVIPFKIFHWRSRLWLLRKLKRIIMAPYYAVEFPDFWLADQMTSLSGVLLDVEYTLCFFAFDWKQHPDHAVCTSVQNGIRPIIACLPAWFRFAQCLRRYRDTNKFFPHAVNAGKYSTTFIVVLFSSLYRTEKGNMVLVMIPCVSSGVFLNLLYYTCISLEQGAASREGTLFAVWIIAYIVNFCYTLWWDMYMDWGVLDRKYSFLREELIYPHPLIYYVAIVEDSLFRLFWTFQVSLLESEVLEVEVLKTVFGFFEMLRRFVWNFFRLENEHLNNCGEFRAVRDIKIKPLDIPKAVPSSAQLNTKPDVSKYVTTSYESNV